MSNDCILILTLILNYFFISVNEINIIFIFIFCSQWINEICLVNNELIGNKKINNFFFFINIIFFCAICLFSFFLFNYLLFVLLAYFIHIIIFSLIFLDKIKLSCLIKDEAKFRDFLISLFLIFYAFCWKRMQVLNDCLVFCNSFTSSIFLLKWIVAWIGR